MFSAIRRMLLSEPENFEGPYRAFTRENDLELDGNQIEEVVGQLPYWSHYPSPDFDAFYEAHPSAQFNAEHAMLTPSAANCAVSLLLDHSGSLRGDRICRVAMLAGFTSAYLHSRGIPHEVLGFTTSSWKGGASAQQWRSAGRPPAPGRLCDLLHVVHRRFSESDPLSLASMRAMTCSGLLKENVDGEALEWAAKRLAANGADRNILIVVSDGAPVDDSTLLVNGPNILDDHLREVTAALVEAGEIELYGVGIDYAMYRYYPQYVTLTETSEIGSLLLPTLRAILASPILAPRPDQLPLPNLASD